MSFYFYLNVPATPPDPHVLPQPRIIRWVPMFRIDSDYYYSIFFYYYNRGNHVLNYMKSQ